MPMYGRDNSLGVSGTSAAPAAGTAIATIGKANLPPGTYVISVDVALRGTPGPADDINVQLQAGATVITKLPIIGVAGFNGWDYGPYQRTLDGNTDLTMNAVGNATAGSVYVAGIRATRMEVY
jgi:hypothetical protein